MANASKTKPWLKFYFEGVEEEIQALKWRNLPEFLREASRTYAGQPAFTICLPNGMAATLTFAELDRWSDALAVYLREVAKLKVGDRIAIQMPNALANPIAIVGALKAGLVIVNTNPLYTVPEMLHQFTDSGAVAVIALDLFADRLAEVLPKTKIKTVLIARVGDFFPWTKSTLIHLVQKFKDKSVPAISFSHSKFLDALTAGEKLQQGGGKSAQSYEADIDLESLALLQYTGGTTGVSKGAMLTHGNLISNVQQMTSFISDRLKPGVETILTVLPLYHVFAFTVNLVTLLRVGAHNILIPNPRPLSNLKVAFARYPITWFTGVNTLFNGLANEAWFQASPPKSLHTSVAGGMALQSAVADRWLKASGTPVYEGYGLTESSPVLTFNPIGPNAKKDTIGIPVPSTEIKCVDEDGKEVPLGTPGELIARGPQIMKGYWEKPEETAKSLRGGWLYTGDVATQDADGFFRIVDRKKDMILVSGFNVFPNEVEDAIAKNPKVLEVAVIGVPDAENGEAVKAFIVPKDPSLTLEEVRSFCRGSLTGYKIPKFVEFRKELPKSPVGKILRKELRTPASKQT